jgi:hypothetical protein
MLPFFLSHKFVANVRAQCNIFWDSHFSALLIELALVTPGGVYGPVLRTKSESWLTSFLHPSHPVRL